MKLPPLKLKAKASGLNHKLPVTKSQQITLNNCP